MIDQTPITWVDGVTTLDDNTVNTEIRNAYTLLLNPPSCQLHRSTAQTITGPNVWTAISWDTLNYDTEDPATPFFSAGSPTKMTIQTPGWYLVNGAVSIGNADATLFVGAMAVRVNSTTFYNLGSVRAPGNRTLFIAGSTLIPFNTGDFVELMVEHTDSISCATGVNPFIPLFTVIRWRGI
jgi:hypothetical protein